MALLKEWVFKSFAEKVAALESAGPQCLVQARRAQLAGSFEPGLAFLAAVALEFVEASSRSGLRVIFLFFRSVLPVSSHPQPDLGDF